jgi:2-methylcitrate synthase
MNNSVVFAGFVPTSLTTASVGGLRGQSAGSTAICTVGKEGIGLTCRGYHLDDLAENATFEEVAYLLLKGTLPNRQELDDFKKRLKRLRSLSPALKEVLERIPKDTQPMESSVRGTSMLGALEPELDFTQQDAIAERLLASLPSMLCYWYRLLSKCRRCGGLGQVKQVSPGG